MTMRRYVMTVTTDASGDATAYSARFSGRLHAIHYIPNAVTPYTNTVDFTITKESTGENVWVTTNVAAQASKYPRAPTHDSTGAAALYAAAGQGVLDYISFAQDRVQIVLAQGGATKVGRFQLEVDG